MIPQTSVGENHEDQEHNYLVSTQGLARQLTMISV